VMITGQTRLGDLHQNGANQPAHGLLLKGLIVNRGVYRHAGSLNPKLLKTCP
jgi:hypothetical protein